MNKYQVLNSDSNCLIGNCKAPKQPVIIDSNYQVYWLFTEYLMHLKKVKNSAHHTVQKYAYGLTYILNYLRENISDIKMLTNDDLHHYIEQEDKGKGERTYDANRLVNALCWAQSKGMFPTICGTDDAEKGITFPVTAVKSRSKGAWTSDFKRTERKTYRAELASEEDIDKILDGLADKFQELVGKAIKPWQAAICERDILMLSFQMDGGLRPQEVVNIKTKDLPSRAKTDEAVKGETLISVFIELSKGDKSRFVDMSAVLVSQIWDFIENGTRSEIISGRDKNRGNGFRDELYVFPSKGNGGAITVRRYHQVISEQVSDVNPQMLRRNGLTNITIAAIEHLRETKGEMYSDDDALIYASGIAGHNKPTTTERNYVKTHRVIDADKFDRKKPYAIIAKVKKLEKENAELKEHISKSGG